MLKLIAHNLAFDTLLSVFNAFGILYYISVMQEFLNPDGLANYFLLISLSQFLISFLNFGSEYKFLIDCDFDAFKNERVILTFRRLFYYLGTGFLLSLTFFLYDCHLFFYECRPVNILTLFFYISTQFFLIYLGYLAVALKINRSNLLGSLFFNLSSICFLYLIEPTSISELLFIFTLSSFIKIFYILKSIVAALPHHTIISFLRYGENGDKIFKREWFYSYLGNPIGFLYVYIVNQLIVLTFNSSVGACLIFVFKVFNQMLSVATSVIGPLFFSYSGAFLKYGKSTFFISLIFINFLVLFLFNFIIQLNFMGPLFSFLFKTVSYHEALYYLKILSPIFSFGFISCFFVYSFPKIGGIFIRNILLLLISFFVLLMLFASQMNYFNLSVFHLIFIEVLYNLLFSYFMADKLYEYYRKYLC